MNLETDSSTSIPPSNEAPDNQDFSPSEIEYVSYQGEHHLPLIMNIVDQELSEPYSIFTYRYFVYLWPQLCFLAFHKGSCVGTVVCKMGEHRDTFRGYIAMLVVIKPYRGKGIGFFLNPRFQYEEGFLYSDSIRSGVTKVIERLAPNVTFAIEATREIAQFRGKIGRFGDLTAQTAIGIMNPATELVTRSIQVMMESGCEEVTLEAEVTNKGALALYGRLGFIRAKRLFRYYLNGVDAFRLKLLFPRPDLNPPLHMSLNKEESHCHHHHHHHQGGCSHHHSF